MNKEYIYLSGEELIVADERGHVEKRAVESDNMHDLLLLENDLEEVDSSIEKVNNLINEINAYKRNPLNLLKFFIYHGVLIFLASVEGAAYICNSAANNKPMPVEGVIVVGCVVGVGIKDVLDIMRKKDLKKLEH